MLSLQFSSLKETITYNKLQAVFLPINSGQVEILPDHSEAFFILQPGEIIIQQKNSSKKITINTSAIAHINNNEIMIVSS